ncbi:MAG: uL15 family ribosomal protein [Nanoarchaeota archaeon]
MKRKKKKVVRMLGRKTFGYGSRKKHKGAGGRGGRGMAGTGKRADHRKSWVLANIGPSYYGKRGFVPIRKKEIKAINLSEVQEKLEKFLKLGIAKKNDGGIEVDLSKAGYNKLLGAGNLHVKEKLFVKVQGASRNAERKITEGGGKVLKP